MRFKHKPLAWLLLGSLSAMPALAADTLFVKIEDLVPSAQDAFNGSDIDAVELSDPSGLARYFARSVVDAQQPSGDAPTEATAALGAPVLLVPDSPYVHSLNGGSLVLEISSFGQQVGDDWQLTVYEADGTQYEAGSPDPYRISVAASTSGPWRVLGIGAGISRFSLADGKPTISAEQLTQVREAVQSDDGDKSLPDFLEAIISRDLARIARVDELEQIDAELQAYLSYYQVKAHDVIDHGNPDNGSLLASRRILTALLERQQQLSES